jgi:hypothetical protein
MNIDLTLIVLLIVVLVVINVVVQVRAKRRGNGYGWQPDLSHKVLTTYSPGPTTPEPTVNLVEKTPEERAEERRSYLKENPQ